MRTASMQFRLLSREEAQTYLAGCKASGNFTAENHGDRIAAQRALLDVTTPAERTAVKKPVKRVTYPCVKCGKHAFPLPGVRCYWCENVRLAKVKKAKDEKRAAVNRPADPTPHAEPRTAPRKAKPDDRRQRSLFD